ncbi:MAG: TlpA disulfide reductase family protein [Rubripirellula sp.]
MKTCPIVKQHSHFQNQWTICGLAFFVAVIVGCGRSETDQPPVVPPPGLSDSTSTRTESQDPPGTIELPDGVDPNRAETQEATSKDGGLEMPSNVQLPQDGQSAIEKASDDASVASAPVVKYGTWDEIQGVVKSSGRITVVDLWSLSCEPCLKEFPGLVALHQSMGSSVQCIAVDLDFDGRASRPPEHYEERVAAFLTSVKASGFPTYISKTPSDDVFASTKLPSIPAVLIYDEKGEVVKVFVDAGDSVGFSYEKDVVPFVQSIAG